MHCVGNLQFADSFQRLCKHAMHDDVRDSTKFMNISED